MSGIAVVGAAGGVGTTLLAAALALAAADAPGDAPVRVLGLDAHGGGPHALWGVHPQRTVDDLLPVRGEVTPAHVQQVLHRHEAGPELVVGPCTPLADALWGGSDAGGLAAALTAHGLWVADLGRGGSALQRAVLSVARDVVVVTCASPGAAATAAALAGDLPAGCRLTLALVRRRDEPLSVRAMRRLVGHDPLEVPWDRAGAERCAAGASPGRRGLWAAVAMMRNQAGVDA